MKAKPRYMAFAAEDAGAPVCCTLTQGRVRAHFTWCDAGFAKEVLHNGEKDELRLCLGCFQIWLLPMPQAISEALWEAGGVGHARPGQQLLLERYALLAVELQRAGRLFCAVLWGINLAYWPAAGAQLAIVGQQQEAASATRGRGLWSVVWSSHIPLGP